MAGSYVSPLSVNNPTQGLTAPAAWGDAVNAACDYFDTLISDAAIVWTAPTLLNSWVNYGGAHTNAGYTKINRVVYIRGLIKDGTVAAATGAFNLPVGFRPAAELIFAVIEGADSIGRLDILSNGTVQPLVGNNGFFSLNVCFPV